MDFSQFDSRAAADKPQFLHLKSPANGELIYDLDKDGKPDETKPCGVMTLGIESAIGQRILHETNKDKMKAGADDDDLNEALVKEIKRLAPLITEFRNIDIEGRPAKAPDDVVRILNMSVPGMDTRYGSFLEQYRVFIRRRDNFLGNGKAS